MKNFGKKSTNRRRVITTPDEGAPRIWCLPIWWDPSASQLMAGSGDSAEPVLSPRHMAQLCERASRVVVLGYDDQAPAMSALGEVCPPEKISVVYGVKSRPPSWHQESLRNQDIDIIQRPYIVPYDYPLGRLQSTISLSTDADVISLFQATVAGEFHEFWGLPLTVEAAKLWAAVGDVFRYSLPANIESIEFRHNIPKCILSAIRPKRPARNPAESDGDVSVARIVAQILDTLMGRSRTRLPLKSCRVESIANVVFKRRAIRRLLPLAWAGTHDPRSEVQKRAADSSSGALNDPRSWIWRALLKATEGEVGRAYLEAGIAWVLARFRHPELFPPLNRLFDEPARRYLAENGSPFTKTVGQRP
ncbi:MAG: hypothetical protein ACUVQK_00590 [Thermogutta sp.]